ncbi:oxygen-independent coproporphyrinogen III oxidase [Mucilaginibacter terrae]|uniref:Coproporphyrinogen-III oxidase n=1 Tax=Mucilaginibacter terrae TaxID=1955052 RepID=A0ABU3GNW4_9SPHI|nr:oxygen-independent coproporphyrinogen III oxidase [Mucilaginibacter terrae]MDT3401469.1 oxygen-independent coproporphyrinogen-3 oxidase [Mucilaginibacter terrae]
MEASAQLLQKYQVAVPRYTSYPTVPYWDTEAFTTKGWMRTAAFAFEESNQEDGISLYVHLPYCESLCTYCGCNTHITKNHAVELPYIHAVLKEWSMCKRLFKNRPVISEIHLGGGTPTFFSADNLQILINGLLEGAIVKPGAEFSFEAHPANTTEEHLQALYNLGFRRLSLGIQDFDPKVQLIINRLQSFEQVKTVTDKARKVGYTSVNFDLIYGLPLQTVDSINETIMQVAQLMPDRIAFYSYAHVPWVKPGQRKFTEEHLPNPETKKQLHELGRHMLTKLGYHEIGMDHFALHTDSLYHAQQSQKLHRNFMGYTHQYTKLSIGLGVSAISDSWYAFAQNVKTVEEYLKLVNNGTLPVTKGHILTREDLIIRRHILEIMCTGKTCWNFYAEPCIALVDGIARLEELAEDGLIELNSWCLTVTPTGKRFLRNICMALDARLWADKPATQLFSMAG